MKEKQLEELLVLARNLRQELKEKVTTKTRQCEYIFDAEILFREQGHILRLKKEVEIIDKFILTTVHFKQVQEIEYNETIIEKSSVKEKIEGAKKRLEKLKKGE